MLLIPFLLLQCFVLRITKINWDGGGDHFNYSTVERVNQAEVAVGGKAAVRLP